MKPDPLPKPALSIGDEFGAPTSAVLLRALQSAHRHCEDCLNEIERATAKPERDAAAFTAARFRISHASLAKRTIIAKACEHLLELVEGQDADNVQAVQQLQLDCTRVSSEHVRRWPPATIATDWRGYCDASRDVRTMMRHANRVEQRTLYPLLARFEHI